MPFCIAVTLSPRRGVSVAVEGLALRACTLCFLFSVLCSLGRWNAPENFALALQAPLMVFYWDLRMGLARHDPTPCCFAPAELMRAGRPGPPDR